MDLTIKVIKAEPTMIVNIAGIISSMSKTDLVTPLEDLMRRESVTIDTFVCIG